MKSIKMKDLLKEEPDFYQPPTLGTDKLTKQIYKIVEKAVLQTAQGKPGGNAAKFATAEILKLISSNQGK